MKLLVFLLISALAVSAASKNLEIYWIDADELLPTSDSVEIVSKLPIAAGLSPFAPRKGVLSRSERRHCEPNKGVLKQPLSRTVIG